MKLTDINEKGMYVKFILTYVNGCINVKSTNSASILFVIIEMIWKETFFYVY